MAKDSYKPKRSVLYVIIAVVVVAFALMAYGQWSKRSTSTVDGSRLVSFARCLKDNGAVFYGTFWCSHCQDQKELFGSAQSELPYVECSTADGRGQLQICTDNEIAGYPTWVFADGSSVGGTQTLQELADKTGCSLPQ